MYTEQKNNKKLKQLYQRALTIKVSAGRLPESFRLHFARRLSTHACTLQHTTCQTCGVHAPAAECELTAVLWAGWGIGGAPSPPFRTRASWASFASAAAKCTWPSAAGRRRTPTFSRYATEDHPAVRSARGHITPLARAQHGRQELA